jgi:hypothetical protein
MNRSESCATIWWVTACEVKIDGIPQLAAEVVPGAVGQLHVGFGVEVSATLEPTAVTVYSS